MHVCPWILSSRENRTRFGVWLLEKVNAWRLHNELGILTPAPRKLDFEVDCDEVDFDEVDRCSMSLRTLLTSFVSLPAEVHCLQASKTTTSGINTPQIDHLTRRNQYSRRLSPLAGILTCNALHTQRPRVSRHDMTRLAVPRPFGSDTQPTMLGFVAPLDGIIVGAILQVPRGEENWVEDGLS
jgi:hypothetical protein